MNITTSHAQIMVKDITGSCGANVNTLVSGYVADLQLWGDAMYIARRKGDTCLHIIIAPSDRWVSDIEADDFEIIGKLSDLANEKRINPHPNDDQ